MGAKDRQIAKQGRQIKALEKQVAELVTLLQAEREEKVQLNAQIAALEKNSSTSSKPPSSDIVKWKTEVFIRRNAKYRTKK